MLHLSARLLERTYVGQKSRRYFVAVNNFGMLFLGFPRNSSLDVQYDDQALYRMPDAGGKTVDVILVKECHTQHLPSNDELPQDKGTAFLLTVPFGFMEF